MVEKNIQALFTAWVELNRHLFSNRSVVWELKLEKGNAMPFSKVQNHQISALLEVKDGGFYHKIGDSPFGHSSFKFHIKRPFDCFLINGEAFVVVVFYKPKAYKFMCWIDIEAFLKEKADSKRKSLTLERAEQIASHKYLL